jgi:hypothetical protein
MGFGGCRSSLVDRSDVCADQVVVGHVDIRIDAEGLQHKFIRAKHDDRTRNDAQHVRNEPTVESDETFFTGDEEERLSETSVLCDSVDRNLAQAGADDLGRG